MKKMLHRLSAFCVITVLVAVASGQTSAPVASAIPAAKSPSPEELSQAELLKSYLQLREQLQATQLAIATSRIEAEVTVVGCESREGGFALRGIFGQGYRWSPAEWTPAHLFELKDAPKAKAAGAS